VPPAKSQAGVGTRTRREVAKIEALGEEDLLTLSVDCLHALNRRAKRYPELSATIYALKNRFLRAAVLAGVAEVGRFETERVTGYYHECTCSAGGYYGDDEEFDDDDEEFDDDYDLSGREPRSWYSREERSSCRSCGATRVGKPQHSKRLWYLVRVLGKGFHQPGPAEPVFDRVALSIEAHDPTNPNTGIPKVGLTIAVQHLCVERAATLLERSEMARQAAPPNSTDQLVDAEEFQGQEASNVAQF